MIDDIVRDLERVEKTFKSLIVTRNYCIIGSIISWRGYKPGISNRIPYIREFEELLNERQYSFLFIDKSYVQIYYQFDKFGSLLSARLAYYPYPLKLTNELLDTYFDESMDDILSEVYLSLLEQEYVTNTSHIRFDYDATVTSHAKSHLQFAGINNLRVPVQMMVTPYLFIDFVARHFFHQYHDNIRRQKAYLQGFAKSLRSVEATPGFNEESLYVTLTGL